MKIQTMVTSLEDLREGHGKANNVPVIKAAMDYVGLKGGSCRPPIHTLSKEERSLVISIIKGWNL
jgi:dihydrodipicolinate synthase/N-acetylneuraminate lyase